MTHSESTKRKLPITSVCPSHKPTPAQPGQSPQHPAPVIHPGDPEIAPYEPVDLPGPVTSPSVPYLRDMA